MAPSDVEHQLKFIIYTLERASELADDAGNTCAALCLHLVDASVQLVHCFL